MLRDFLVDLCDYKKTRILIGKGGFAEVLVIVDKTTKKKYAAKISSLKESQKFILSEVEIGCKIKHPTLLQYIGFSMIDFRSKPHPIIITEYMPNGSLRKLFDDPKTKPRLPNWNTKRYIILLGIVLGMKHLHSNNIIHRDLKPGNILIDENYYTRICDYGFARFSDQDFPKFKMDSSLGTQFYMAPEIIHLEYYDFKVDVYSFSLVLF